MSRGNDFWKIWTKPVDGDAVYSAEGPFGPEMIIRDNEDFPREAFLPPDLSTIVMIPVKLSFIQTVQGRGAPSKDLVTLRQWLVEHLGVHYRGYLQQDDETYDTTGSIIVSVGNDHRTVPPINVPLGNSRKEYIEIELGGKVTTLKYVYGTLDEVARDKFVAGHRAMAYYQGNIPTQGIDIRLGKRVIATKQFETIWKAEDGTRQIMSTCLWRGLSTLNLDLKQALGEMVGITVRKESKQKKSRITRSYLRGTCYETVHKMHSS